MNILIVHDRVQGASRKDETDTLVQVREVGATLEIMGHQCATLGITLELGAARQRIEQLAPDLIFNLVEAIEGQGRLIHLAPSLFEAMGMAYTGVSAQGQFATSNKLVAKRMMQGARIPTPPWVSLADAESFSVGQWIVKSVWEHASIGLSDASIVDASDLESLRAIIVDRLPSLGGEAFAERYIDGREFNISLLARDNGPEALPPAEILFDGYDSTRPKIVGWSAKWEQDSFEYHHTPRRYEFGHDDCDLLGRLVQIALSCWRLFDLRGYARVDFRVDECGRPWVLEVNANPCLSGDAGFAAALARAGIPFNAAIARIIEDARVPSACFPLAMQPT